jgi:hypothetical protein
VAVGKFLSRIQVQPRFAVVRQLDGDDEPLIRPRVEGESRNAVLLGPFELAEMVKV